jgi:CheY-like chemotaxis protein
MLPRYFTKIRSSVPNFVPEKGEMETKTNSSKKSPAVLIVDDDETLRYSLGRISKIAGLDVLEASSGQEAIMTISRSAPDIVVSDVVLPDFDGFELCRRLKADKSTENIPVVLISSMYYDPERSVRDLEKGRARAKTLGAVALMPRGETMDQLVPLLKSLIGNRNPGSRQAAK